MILGKVLTVGSADGVLAGSFGDFSTSVFEGGEAGFFSRGASAGATFSTEGVGSGFEGPGLRAFFSSFIGAGEGGAALASVLRAMGAFAGWGSSGIEDLA